jgi:hypothetical protein
MICPQCQGEYREGFTTCATCEIPLVSGPENSTDDNAHPVRLIPLLVAGTLGAFIFIGAAALGKGVYTWTGRFILVGLVVVFALWMKIFRLE